MRQRFLAMATLLASACGGGTQAFTCNMYCGSDFANERTYTVQADNQSHALDQCFADHFPCPLGMSNLPKCTCH